MVTVNTNLAIVFFYNSFGPGQVFFQLDNLVFASLAAATPHKTGESHAPVRVNLPKQPAVQGKVQYLAVQAVAPVRTGHPIAMSKEKGLALKFKL